MYLEFIAAKNDYLRASHRAFACGLTAASGGNISVRLDGDKMLVKPSGITLGEASEENLLITDLHGQPLEGKQKPTKETILHGGLYRALERVGAVVHVHPVYSIMCANCFDELPLVTKQMKQVMQTPVPICKVKSLTVDDAAMREILGLFEADPGLCCFLLEEHGVVAVGPTAAAAEDLAELVEENARVYWETACLAARRG